MSEYSSSFLSESEDLNRLRKNNLLLHEELKQCKADKDFVWSLWKRLQVANPDITQAIGLVLEREKEKWDSTERKLTETISRQNDSIDELKESAVRKSEEISQLISSKLETQNLATSLQTQLEKSKAETIAMQCQIQELESQSRDTTASHDPIRELDKLVLELKQQINAKELECNELRKVNENSSFLLESQRQRLVNLDEDKKVADEAKINLLADNLHLRTLLRQCEDEMNNQKFVVGCKDREMESLRRELSELWQTHQQTVEHNNQQSELVKQLQQLHLDTQNVLHKREEAFVVDLAEKQCRIHELEQMVKALRENSLESSYSQHKEGTFGGRVGALETDVTELKRRMHSESSPVRIEVVPVEDACQAVTERDRRRRLLRSRSLTTVDRQPSSLEPQNNEVKGLQQKLAVINTWNEELKSALSAKNNELEMVRSAHGRRLERLRSVVSSYRLVKQQLKLYEDDYMCSKNKTKKKCDRLQQLPRATAKQLQNEDSDVVWNELTHFKNENKALKVEKLVEDCDQLKVKSASDIATIHELRCCLQEHFEELKMLRDQMNQVVQVCDSKTKLKVDVARTQLERACHDIGFLREEVHQLKADKEDLLSEKRSLLTELALLHNRESKNRIGVCNIKRELFRLQRKLRKKRAWTSHFTKQTEINKSDSKTNIPPMSNDRDAYWEDITSSADSETPAGHLNESVIFDTISSCSLGQAIAAEAKSREHVRGGPSKERAQRCNEQILVHDHQGRTSTPSLEIVPVRNTLSAKQKLLIKDYVRELTKNTVPLMKSNVQSIVPRPCCESNTLLPDVPKPSRSSASRTIATLKQRIDGLQKQVNVLKQSKEAAVKARAEQQRDVELLTEQLSSTNQKLTSSRQFAQRLSTDLERARLDKESLDAKLAANAEASLNSSTCSGGGKLEQELINSLQSRLKISTASLSKQLDHNKLLKAENEKQNEKILQQTERISHLERDLSQKRILMDDIKLKLTIAQENAETDSDIMLEVEAKLKSLAENNSRLKTQVDYLKCRLTSAMREKYQSEATTARLGEEIERKTKQVSELQKKLFDVQSRLSDVEFSAEQHMRTLAEHTETAIDAAQTRLSTADQRLKEHLKFVKVLAFTLLSTSKQMRSLLSQKKANCSEKPQVSFSASTVHRSSALSENSNISHSELSELLASTAGSEDAALNEAAAKDVKWAKKCENLLQLEGGFALALVDLFMEKVEEKGGLIAQLSCSQPSAASIFRVSKVSSHGDCRT